MHARRVLAPPRVLASVAGVLMASLATAGTSLWVKSDPDDPVGGGVERSFSSAEGAFTASIGIVSIDTVPNASGGTRFVERQGIFLQVESRSGPGEGRWNLSFAPPTLAPGAYPNAASSDSLDLGVPRLAVGHLVTPGLGGRDPCGSAAGEFTISELVRGPSGELVSFAADFVQRCSPGPGSVERGALRGSVRFHVGDDACRAASDGAPCDDGNACSHGDVCRSGDCAGTTASDTCDPATCDDGNVCTADGDEAGVGCRNVLDGSCWSLATGSLRTSVTFRGRTCGCRIATADGILALHADGTFRSPGGRLPASVCPSHVGVTVPDEVGTWRRLGQSRRLRLRTTNLRDIVAAARTCAGRGGRVQGYATRALLSADGRGIKMVRHFTISVPGAGAPLVVVSRATGGPGTGTLGGPSVGALGDVAQGCAERITHCLGG